MQDSMTEHLAQAIKCGVLTAAAGFGYFWIMANHTSDEWRLGGIALGFLALLFTLATIISVLSLTVGLIAAGFTGGLNYITVPFRFYAFRKTLAIVIGSSIAVGGAAIASFYDPVWSIAPAVIGVFIIKSPRLWETLKHQPWFYRIFISGRTPQEEFAQIFHLKKYSKPFRATYRSDGGYCSNELFIGTSTRESS